MGTMYGATELNYEDVRNFTCDFSREGFISKFTYGTVYRGRNGEKDLTVKIWDNYQCNGVGLISEEFYLFNNGNFKGHPKAIGYCMDGKNPSVVVYDFNPLDTVHNLIPKDSFSWVERIKVALGFATTLVSFHGGFPPCIIRSIDAAHILCDENYTPILYEFGMTAGRFFSTRWKGDRRFGSPGYMDPYFLYNGECSTKSDVFAYGIVLLGLISKKNSRRSSLDDWAETEYENKSHVARPSLVVKRLKSQPYFDLMDGRTITELAMRCIRYEPDERPDMDEVVEVLKSLNIVINHGDETGINMMLERLM